MNLTIVTVLHDSADDLGRLLDSVEAQLPGRPQIVAVDSGSADDGAALAQERGADVVRLRANLGFGAANNAGLARAHHDVVALLNPDIVLRDDGLERLAAAARARDALHVPRLLHGDGRPQDSVHPLPGGAVGFLRAVSPGPLRRRLGERSAAWAIAAALVARRTTLERLGPFDPGVFLYAEDLDLCLRARAGGVPTVLHREVALVHAGAHSTHRAFGGEPIDLQVRRRRVVIEERLGARALARDDAAVALEHGLRSFRARDRAHLRALRAARG